MARSTKQEAQATRSHILDTAEHVFEKHGVSGTSLHEIAKAAGLTRGAIYWHFTDKADLFNAMMERATMPLEETDSVCGFKSADITLAQMREGFVGVLKRVVADPQMKRVFAIATHKVEYTDEMRAARDRHLEVRNACLADVARVLRQAMRRGELARRMPAKTAAVGLHALLDGLLQNWMLDPAGFDLVKVGGQVLDAYLGSLVAAIAPSPQPSPASGRGGRPRRVAG
jgi:TetR/AcrR family transcriptional regulator, acrAB operon repressor